MTKKHKGKSGKPVNLYLDGNQSAEQSIIIENNKQIISIKAEKPILEVSGFQWWSRFMPSESLYEFVRNAKGNLTDAQYDAAQEWASVAVPKGKPIGSGAISNGKKSYYEKKGQNSSSDESTKKVIEILTKIQSYHANKKKV
ncbi:hypothetical protein HYG93_08935 [Acinetobacter sp. SwsAc6]|uniref:hypothetical protein n=1 Tax=Acinetobacter TaxID=469 RepID=UPI000EA33F7F|nr:MULTISPECIES: hypothetical protein [Acinetobacter]NWK74416.1 hypothetical protein [Acinetobacter sp. SwsAc6]RKG41989.1 hypothetical protein D7V51_12805 [Acinetobacter cumulans]RKG47686.1 hypothetical protein D7V68_10585 [Acinetobacter cumulans]RZG57926.1 hypothetical protein EXE29_12430 [Acinetobacter sp. WCHAc060006]